LLETLVPGFQLSRHNVVKHLRCDFSREEWFAFLTKQVSLVAVANYRVEPQPKQRRQIVETGTSMEISTSN
jgi:hypothetical protein